jgi:hypothetical protein
MTHLLSTIFRRRPDQTQRADAASGRANNLATQIPGLNLLGACWKSFHLGELEFGLQFVFFRITSVQPHLQLFHL